MFPNRDAHSEHERRAVGRESVVELVGQTLVRFRAEVGRMAMAFVWGIVFGSVLSQRPPTKAEQEYDEAHRRAMRIVNRQSQEASRGNPPIQSHVGQHDWRTK